MDASLETSDDLRRQLAELKAANGALHGSEEKYRTLFGAMDQGYCTIEVMFDHDGRPYNWRYIEVNAAFENASGLADATGKTILELVPDLEPKWFDIYGRVARTSEARRIEGYVDALDRWINLYAFRIGDPSANTVAVLFNDVTARKHAEIAVRESEERFRQFADASSDALWIRDAKTLSMEYVSPAMRAIYGVEPDSVLGEVRRWASLIVPDDRDIALNHLAEARGGNSVVHEFRIQRPTDGSFRWIRDTDFPLLDDLGRIQRIGGIATDITEAKLATEHQDVLLAELQHRVRNIMAMIRSITARTGERAGTVPEYAAVMAGRLLALARVQALLTRAPNVSVGIASIVRDEISAQAQHERQYRLEGPDIALSPKAAEVLTLAVHELATNALKYGALSVPDGKVAVGWTVTEKRGAPWLSFEWTEQGAPQPKAAGDAPRRGFGSELIENRIPYELGGRGTVSFGPGGARCLLEFPLTNGASVLETGAPLRAAVFGGSIDMTGEPDLRGNRILVMEDDYYLATDAARALQGAGAEVVGPMATEDAARAELDGSRVDAAVLDINLGSGPSFKLAKALRDRRIPFIFTTGYDQQVIPKEFRDVERLVKPIQLRHIVQAIARLLRPAA